MELASAARDEAGVGRRRGWRGWRGWRRAILATSGVACLYLAASVVPYWHYWTAGGTLIAGKGGDPAVYSWFLAWTPYALWHGHNPLITDWGNYPSGVNAVANISMPLLGVLGAPVTLLFGSFVTTTLLFTLAFPLSALSGYFFIRRWVRWRPAALSGGLLYGFSPYMTGQGLGHLNLVFVPLPPLIFLTLSHIVSGRARRAWACAGSLAALCAAQFFISAEVLASTVIAGAIGLCAAALVSPGLARRRWRFAARAIGAGMAVTAVLLAYPAWLMIAGPGRVAGPAQGTSLYRGNLLAPFIPGSAMHFRVAAWLGLADNFSGNTSENGLYLGVPLLVLLAAGAVALRTRPVMRIAVIATTAAFVLSLGSRLTIGRHVIKAVPLPEAALTRIPILDNTISARYSLYVMLGAAVMLALTVEAIHERLPAPAPRAAVATAAVTAAALLPLTPAWPYTHQVSQVPRYFYTGQITAIPPSSVAVEYPFPTSDNALPMLWQVAAMMRFKSPGGRFIVPSQRPTIVLRVFTGLERGNLPPLTPALRSALTAQFDAWHVRTLLVEPSGRRPALVIPFFEWVTGRPPDVRSDGIVAWRR